MGERYRTLQLSNTCLAAESKDSTEGTVIQWYKQASSSNKDGYLVQALTDVPTCAASVDRPRIPPRH